MNAKCYVRYGYKYFIYIIIYTMIYTKNSDWSIQSISGDNSITLSEYYKATITYDKEYEVVVTEDAAEQITDVDAKGKTIVLGTRVVQKPVVDKEGKPVVKKEIREVRYNPYDAQSVVIIPDDAKVITEEEYNKLLEEQKAKLQAQK